MKLLHQSHCSKSKHQYKLTETHPVFSAKVVFIVLRKHHNKANNR